MYNLPKLDIGGGEGMAGVIGAGDGPLDEFTEVGSTVVCGSGVPISVGVELDNLLALLLTCNDSCLCFSSNFYINLYLI